MYASIGIKKLTKDGTEVELFVGLLVVIVKVLVSSVIAEIVAFWSTHILSGM
jgi:hypothetical protein